MKLHYTLAAAVAAGSLAVGCVDKNKDQGMGTSSGGPDGSMTSAAAATQDWPKGPREQVETLTKTYGPPSGVTASRVIWDNPPKPWHQIIVYKETIDHNWPAPHQDYLEQVVFYPVPEDKFDDLAMFDGSVIAERTAGTLAARCHTEWANLIALNLAHDIIEGTKSVDEAKAEYAKAAMQKMKGTGNPEIASKLLFEPTTAQKARHPAEPAMK